MNIFSKFFALGKHKLEEKAEQVIESAADIATQGRIIIKSIEKKEAEIVESLNEAQKLVCSSKNDIDEINAKIDVKNESAIAAVKQGDDNKATLLLNDVSSLEIVRESHVYTVSSLEPIIEKQVAYVNTLKAQKQNLLADIKRMDVEEKAYKARAKLVGGSASDCPFDIQQIRDRVKNARATVESQEILNERLNTDLDKDLTPTTTSIDVSVRLQQLKEQHLAK